ncbi:MAG: GH32 C-terminal domain-containing protein [Saprospiraceae bacterium]|nr:GH32 C-terminal domain-containing protein [Saprospiraceae bacterium]
MNLLIDGKIERIASGGNSEQLQWKGWDVREFKGKTARLQIVDEHPGGWGHILVDQIVFADDLAKAETQNAVWLDYGRDNYAGVTWSDIPKEDGRRIFMGWMSNWDYAQVVPTQSWRSAMTLARNLQLQQTEAGPRLMTTFVKEMQQNRGTQTDLQPKKVAGELDITNEMEFEVAAMEAMLEWKIPEGSQANFGIELSNSKGERYRIGFDAAKNSFYSDRSKAGKQDFSADFAGVHYAPRLGFGNTISMHLFFDVASAEMTADQGATAITDIFFPNEDFNQLKLYSENGEVELSSSQFFEMKAAM